MPAAFPWWQPGIVASLPLTEAASLCVHSSCGSLKRNEIGEPYVVALSVACFAGLKG